MFQRFIFTAFVLMFIFGNEHFTSAKKTKEKEKEVPKSGGEGQMVDSKKCPGVKCFEPSADKKCNATESIQPQPTASCCPIFVCGSLPTGQFHYGASQGGFQQGPPPGFPQNGFGPPSGFGGPPPNQFGGPQQFGYMPGPVPGQGMPMQNYQYQQNAASFSQQVPNMQTHGQSYSYSYGAGGSSSSQFANQNGVVTKSETINGQPVKEGKEEESKDE